LIANVRVAAQILSLPFATGARVAGFDVPIRASLGSLQPEDFCLPEVMRAEAALHLIVVFLFLVHREMI
jgi:hypothetical protein